MLAALARPHPPHQHRLTRGRGDTWSDGGAVWDARRWAWHPSVARASRSGAEKRYKPSQGDARDGTRTAAWRCVARRGEEISLAHRFSSRCHGLRPPEHPPALRSRCDSTAVHQHSR